MGTRRYDLAALAALVVTLVVATTAWSIGQRTSGVRFAISNGQVVVADVDRWSLAARDRLVRPGLVLVTDGTTTYLDARPEVQASAVGDARPEKEYWLVGSGDVAAIRAGGWVPWLPFQPAGAGDEQPIDAVNFSWWPGGISGESYLLTLLLAIPLFLGGWYWLRGGAASAALRRYAVTLPAAIAVPLVAGILLTLDSTPTVLLAIALAATGMLPLGLQFAGEASGRKLLLRAIGPVLSAAALVAVVVPGEASGDVRILACYVAISAAVVVPGIAAARLPEARLPVAQRSSEGLASAPPPRRFVDSSDMALAALTPAVSLLSFGVRAWPPVPPAVVMWLAIVLGVRLFTLRPLARIASRATLQRDAIVAATELERARIAADIHDDALQDLTMLVRRLDAAGDTEGADAARAVAARLRAICGDLRLPILDDLGLGPALEWLTERLEPAAGGPVYLERLPDEERLPAAVELAIFRVAQEAMTNAIRHGRPPIVVRYSSGGSWAELEVDDAGSGLDPDAVERARDAGHFGLLNMAQRAEQVGAELDVGQRPGGGTRVTLSWEAEAAAEGAEPSRAVRPVAAT